MFAGVSPGVLMQRLYDADLKREISRVWPSLSQKTVDLLVTPHKCKPPPPFLQMQTHILFFINNRNNHICAVTCFNFFPQYIFKKLLIQWSRGICIAEQSSLCTTLTVGIYDAPLPPSTGHITELSLSLLSRQRANGGEGLRSSNDF